MKRLLLLFLGLSVAGCHPPSSSGGRGDVGLAGEQEINNVPIEALRGVPARLHLLTPGMTHAEVMETLGLAGYRVLEVMSGPSNRLGYEALLSPGFQIVLFFDETKNPPRFLEARLDGDGWKNLQQK